MDQTTLATILKVLTTIDPNVLVWFVIFLTATPFGLVVLLMLFWWLNERKRSSNELKRQEALREYREDMKRVLDAYGRDVLALGQYYKDNVELVKSFEKIANGLQSTVVLNTQTMQKLVDAVCSNQYCPLARANKNDSPMRT